MKTLLKNNAISPENVIRIEDGFFVLLYQNNSKTVHHLTRAIERSLIQFHFSLKGNAIFHFNQGNYTLPIASEKALLLYNPKQDLPLDLKIDPGSWMISVLISIRKFHSLFSEEAGYVDFLSVENRNKKYYTDSDITPAMTVVLHQFINNTMHRSIKNLYIKGKVYELLSLYFNTAEDTDAAQCPFLMDELHISKIRKAKDIVITQITAPPGLQELAHEVGLTLKKLKLGFKQIYGTTVYGFLFDYKMEYARKMLESGEYNVNEISTRIGYSTSSHFIAGFKKKYGTTPKKYVLAAGK